ncbi:hypothetical protein HV824_03035 [Myxococcus sp. AM009]|uniref:hypothetical protein n=1 Tax=Myxococcus sp. AM009 TaxID=2745137 RepID=UPI0015956214|nr:hypothetical protein [Myxococcus sp. AM009]NVI97098.1 hypothetical protein [Myxococcus sp. AM009]
MLGYTFERYREIEGITTTDLANQLGCSRAELQWMSLCRRPLGASFAKQTIEVAHRFAVDPRALVHVLRHVEVITALAQDADGVTAPGASHIQVAARDRFHDDEDGP